MTERWKPVVGWGQLYEVSDAGSIRSLDRVRTNGSGSYVQAGRMLTPHVNRTGHLRVMLCDRDRVERRYVHHLVLEAFTGPRPVGMETRHLNGDAADNRVRNLAWGTRSENNLDAVRHGTFSKNRRRDPNKPCGRGHDPFHSYLDSKRHFICRECKRENARARKESR